ncbi:MAG: hypothetical protein GY841_05810, partial [FCB group bacterium]|nr:hypothetical protein [FCB group bacterium]
YNQLGQVKSQENGRGVKTLYEYDNPFGDVTRFKTGMVESVSQDGGKALKPMVQIVTMEYDANGNQIVENDTKSGIRNEYEYDRLNRLRFHRKKSSDGMEHQMEYKYLENSKVKEAIDPGGNTVYFTYDDRNLLNTVTSGTGEDETVIKYDYNPDGQVEYMYYMAAESDKYHIEYDGHRRKTKITDPMYNSVNFGYDANGNVNQIKSNGVNGASLSKILHYGPRDLLTGYDIEKEEGKITTSFGYNGAGFRKSATLPNGSELKRTPTGSGLTKTIEFPSVSLSDTPNIIYTYDYYPDGTLKSSEEDDGDEKKLKKEIGHTSNGTVSELSDNANGGRSYKYDYYPGKQMLRAIIDPLDRTVVSYKYDGFNRLIEETRLVGGSKMDDEAEKTATKKYVYQDKSNLLWKIIDSADNATEYRYDSKGRVNMVIYPGKSEADSPTWTYNHVDQVKTFTDAEGTVVNNTKINSTGFVVERKIEPAAGVGGSTEESFTINGLGHVRTATNNHSQVELKYTSEGRMQEEIIRLHPDGEGENYTHEYTVKYRYDDAKSQTIITYPSGRELTFTADEFYRLSSIKAETGDTVVDYRYEGTGKLKVKTYLNHVNLSGESFDVANRLKKFIYRNQIFKKIYGREIQWNKLNLKEYALDNGKGETYLYDAANHLRWMHDQITNFSFKIDIDENENLTFLQRAILDLDLDAGESMPISFSDYKENGGDYPEIPLRNDTVRHEYNVRHELITKDKDDGNEFEYDKNGNLKKWKSKGHEYFYDWRNQLVKVIKTVDKETETVEYFYDALGRRVKKKYTAPGEDPRVTLYVNSGYRVLEEYEYDEGQEDPPRLTWLYMYGSGIDEVVAMETDENGDGTLEPYVPLQDTNGNVIAITSGDGKVIEKVRYAPFGSHEILSDKDPPRLQYVAMKDGKLHFRFSEPVDLGEEQNMTITDTASGTSYQSGLTKAPNRKDTVVTEHVDDLPADSPLNFNLNKSGIMDEVLNELQEDIDKTFTTGSGDRVLMDEDHPRVETALEIDGKLEFRFTEELDASSVDGKVNLSFNSENCPGTITVEGNRVIFTPEEPLTDGDYRINVDGSIQDPNGNSMEQPFESSYTRNDTDGATILYVRPDKWKRINSTIGNKRLFHGRTYEPETGLYFYRARYYHPELGRFLQHDPLGYHDSMNLYQGFNMNPVNYTDPMGEAQEPHHLALAMLAYNGEEDKQEHYLKWYKDIWVEGTLTGFWMSDIGDIPAFLLTLRTLYQNPSFATLGALALDGLGLLPGIQSYSKFKRAKRAFEAGDVVGDLSNSRRLSVNEYDMRHPDGQIQIAEVMGGNANSGGPVRQPSEAIPGQQTFGRSPSSRVLGNNMEAVGMTRPADTAAHHIVAGTDKRAPRAREVLRREGIDINAAANGVFLPRSSRYAIEPITTHSRVHTNRYYRELEERILNAEHG